MQLIMSTDIDIGIKSMSSINQESLKESETATHHVQDKHELSNGNKENIENREETVRECEGKDSETKLNKQESLNNESLLISSNEETTGKPISDKSGLEIDPERCDEVDDHNCNANDKEENKINTKPDQDDESKSIGCEAKKDETGSNDINVKETDFKIDLVVIDQKDSKSEKEIQSENQMETGGEIISCANIEKDTETVEKPEVNQTVNSELIKNSYLTECQKKTENIQSKKGETNTKNGQENIETQIVESSKDHNACGDPSKLGEPMEIDDESTENDLISSEKQLDFNNSTNLKENTQVETQNVEGQAIGSCQNLKEIEKNIQNVDKESVSINQITKNPDIIIPQNEVGNIEAQIKDAVVDIPKDHSIEEIAFDNNECDENNTKTDINNLEHDLIICDNLPKQSEVMDYQNEEESLQAQTDNTDLVLNEKESKFQDENLEGIELKQTDISEENRKSKEPDDEVIDIADEIPLAVSEDPQLTKQLAVSDETTKSEVTDSEVIDIGDENTLHVSEVPPSPSPKQTVILDEANKNMKADAKIIAIDDEKPTDVTEVQQSRPEISSTSDVGLIGDVKSPKMENNNTFELNKAVQSPNIQSTDSEMNTIDSEVETVISDNDKIVIDNTEKLLDENTQKTVSESKVKEKKTFSHISKLSNTLDILSDEEDESQKQECPTENPSPPPIEKQCINIEDDDDIMVIDDETISKDDKSLTSEEPKDESIQNEVLSEVSNKEEEIKNESPATVEDKTECPAEETDSLKSDTEPEKKEKKVQELKPLLPEKFLKTCKKNLADMTREELEEFCIIKIVESVVDRSSLGEIKSQLKTMAQTIDEYKRKAQAISKQNRDLQVVLKSVQEEQKKYAGTHVTPLRITRSVGMQVFMSDKGLRKRPNVNTFNNSNTNFANNRQTKPQNNTRKSTPLQIPVPRLVPANNTNNAKNQITPTQSPTNNTKPQRSNSIPNGLKISNTSQKPEKRTHEKMQQNSSVTVDLTDDEPPTKVLTRNAAPPVRCVPPQNLLAPKPALSQPLNSPRKVYIPISGPPNQGIRPGQTIMLKSIPQNPTPRPRNFAPKMVQNSNTLRMMGRVAFKHPAPLPDSMKQYQPPNWKSLPPAPDLKLSKVENGIVISWKIDGYVEENHEEIASYQLFAYQETSSPPSTSLWKKIGDVKALPLPMACTLTQFMAGYKYYFAVRAVDIRSRFGPFSLPGSILLLNKV